VDLPAHEDRINDRDRDESTEQPEQQEASPLEGCDRCRDKAGRYQTQRRQDQRRIG
jgi:hypothetical protein